MTDWAEYPHRMVQKIAERQALEKRQIWLVTRRLGANQFVPDYVGAFFNEANARAHAARIVGGDYVIGLETMPVLDEPEDA